MLIAFAAVLVIMALGGAGYVFAGAGRERQNKRFAAIAKPQAQLRGAAGGDGNALKRKNVQQLLKQIESKTAEQKQKLTMRRRLDQAGMADVAVRTFWISFPVRRPEVLTRLRATMSRTATSCWTERLTAYPEEMSMGLIRNVEEEMPGAITPRKRAKATATAAMVPVWITRKKAQP